MAQYVITVVRKVAYERFVEAESQEVAESLAARVHIFFDPADWQEADTPDEEIEIESVELVGD